MVGVLRHARSGLGAVVEAVPVRRALRNENELGDGGPELRVGRGAPLQVRQQVLDPLLHVRRACEPACEEVDRAVRLLGDLLREVVATWIKSVDSRLAQLDRS